MREERRRQKSESGRQENAARSGSTRRVASTGCRLLVLAALLFGGCAKKMLPPSPDRFSPRLREVVAKSRVKVELEFNEDIDVGATAADSFLLSRIDPSRVGRPDSGGPGGEVLPIRGLSAGRRGERIELWTMPQQGVGYEIQGKVADRAGNECRFRARFQGSQRPDTIPPRVLSVSPGPGATGQRQLRVRLALSEPVDTSKAPLYLFLPKHLDTLVELSWGGDWSGFSLVPGVRRQEAGARSETSAVTPFAGPESGRQCAYFVLLPSLEDLDGTRMREPAYTYFSPDSAPDWVLVRGRACPEDSATTLAGVGVVFFCPAGTTDVEPRGGMAMLLRDGSFTTRVFPGTYEVVAAVDTGLDGLADLVGRRVRWEVGPDTAPSVESLVVRLEPEPVPKGFDGYRP